LAGPSIFHGQKNENFTGAPMGHLAMWRSAKLLKYIRRVGGSH